MVFAISIIRCAIEKREKYENTEKNPTTEFF
jgi:hypothetical protein